MKKGEKNGSSGRTIFTRSLTSASSEQESSGSKTSTRGTPSKKQKLTPPASSTRKSERLASSPASVTTNSGKIEKKNRASPSQRSSKGKNVASENSKGSEKSGRNADTSSDIKESKDILMNNIEELRSKIKKQEPKMTGRSYRALFRGLLKKEVNDSVKDEELVVVGCSRRVPAENDDARDDNSSPHANLESKRLPAGATSLEKDTDSPVKFISDTEKIVLDECPMPETGDASVIGSPSDNKAQKINDSSKDEELVVLGCSHHLPAGNDDARDDNISPHANPELQRLTVGSTTLEKDTDFPVELIRDTRKISSPMAETEDASVIGSPSENLETTEINDSSKDEELVVVGCSAHLTAGNDVARDVNSSPHANTESKRLPVGPTSFEKDTDFPVKLIRDAEKIVLDASPMPEGDASVIGSPSESSKTQKINDSANDEELVVVGCSRRLPAGNDDARGDNSSPHANPESKRLQVGSTTLEKDTDFPVKLIRDTEKIVLDASPTPETRDASVIDSPSENSETRKILASTTNLEIDIDVPLKRKRDTAGIVLDACATVANADVTSTVGVIPSPSGFKNNNQPEKCSRCEKRQKVNDDFEIMGVCSCIAQPVQESYQVAQDMQESGPTTSRFYEENRKNMQQDKSYDHKLSSMYPEYWVPVQLSDVQLEQYCRTLFSKYLSLSSLSKDVFGALEETLTSVRKVCDHPYVMDASMKQMLTKNLELHEILDVEVKASGKLHLLDAMLTQIKTNGLKVVVFYQATQSPGGLLLANILEDFVSQRFGQQSYEHGVVLSKKNAINNFNKESQCFVLLLESRACSQSIKLLRAEAFILFGSSLNPSHDVKLLEKIKIESYSERTKIFRLYSTYTVEEKALILARQNKWQNKPPDNLNRPLTHALLMWGASYLFEKLDRFHGSETPHLGVPLEQSINDGVIHEFSSIISSKVGEEIEGKLYLLLEAKHAQGTYSTDSTLFGEEHVKLSDEDAPNIFWTKLLGGKNPRWKYCLDTSQRSRKRVRYLQSSAETAQIGNDGNIKKGKKDSDHVTVDKDERKASEKDPMGTLMSPKVIALESSRRTASGPSGTSNGNDAFGLCSVGGHIPGIPEDMLAGIDWRQTPPESQRNLHAVLKTEMAKLGKVLHLSEDSTRMVEIILDYVIENYRVCKEPATTLQAFQIALSWIATLMVEQKLNRKESLVHAKSDLAFNCCREEVDYIYSMLYCMKSLFLERLQGHQEKNNTKLMRSSEGEECITEKRGVHYSSAKKDIEKTLRDIKKKCNKRQQNLEQKHEEKKLEVVNKYADKKQKLEDEKEIERAIIRIQCRWATTQSLEDGVKRLDHDHERKIDKITSERDEDLKRLEQMHEDEKKMLTEDEACWISRVEKWAQAELLKCAPIKSGSNKHFSRIYSSNTCKYTPDVQICSEANGEATYTGTNCMVFKGNQVPEAENTLGTMSAGSTQQVHEMVASRNDKEIDVSTLSGEQPTNNAATKSQSNKNASITAPEILIPAGRQEEFPALNVQLSEPHMRDRMTSAPADEDMTSAPEDDDVPLPEISKSFANLAKSASPDFSLNREEALVTIESNRPSQVETDSNNILDQQNEEACSFDKLIPDEIVSPMPPPASVVETGCSTEHFQDDQDICHMPSPGRKQPDPAANSEGQHIEAIIEPQPAGSPMPSSPAGQQPDLAANIQGQNIEAAIEPQPAESETLDTGGFAALEQGDQVACPLPSSLAENQPDLASNIEDQNINTSAEPHIAGPGAVEIGDSAVSDQQVTDAQDECSLPSSLVRTQADLAVDTDCQNMTTIAQRNTAGSDAVETGGSPVSYQSAQDVSALPFSLPRNHPDAAVNIEGVNNTAVAEPHTTRSDACEMELAEPGPQVEQSTFTNNVAQVVNEGGVEPVPSLLNNVTGQSDVQQVPQIPFPVFNDPFQHELEKLRRESENSKKTFEEKKSILKAERERRMAEVQAEYQRKFHEVEAEHTAKTTEIETNKNLLIMNKLLASAFLSKCTNKNASHPSAAPRGVIQQLAQRATQVSALRNYAAPAPVSAPAPAPAPAPLQPQPSSRPWNHATTAPAPAPLQPQTSSRLWNHSATATAPVPVPVPAPLQPQASSRPLGLTLNSTSRPMPPPRQPLISNIAPSLSASPATNSARLRSPAPHINPYRPSSSISTTSTSTTTTSLPLPQAVTYSTVTIQQQEQQQQQNLGNNDVVCLSDDE